MEKIAEEYRKGKGEGINQFFSKAGTGHVVGFAFLFIVLIALNNNKNIDQRYNYVIYFILVGIILVLYYRPGKERKILPDYVVKKIAQAELERKVREGKEIPYDSKVFVSSICDLKWETDLIQGTSKPISWEVGFIELVNGTQLKREGVIRIHPFEGSVIGISYYGLGFEKIPAKDRVIVPAGVIQGNIKTTDYGQPKPNQ